MSTRHIAATLLTAALGVTGLATTASATPSSSTAASAGTAVAQCELKIVRMRAQNLQHDGTGVDNVFVKLGNSRTTTQSYVLRQSRNLLGAGTETFTGSARVTPRVEIAGGASSVAIGTKTLQCRTATREFVVRNGDARYKVRAQVTVL